MMLLEDLTKGLGTILPTTLNAWGKGHAPALPYIAIVDTGREDQFADDTRFIKVPTYRIELYYERKDPALEDKIESFFDASEILWSTDGDTAIDTEGMYERIYYVEKGE